MRELTEMIRWNKHSQKQEELLLRLPQHTRQPEYGHVSVAKHFWTVWFLWTSVHQKQKMPQCRSYNHTPSHRRWRQRLLLRHHSSNEHSFLLDDQYLNGYIHEHAVSINILILILQNFQMLPKASTMHWSPKGSSLADLNCLTVMKKKRKKALCLVALFENTERKLFWKKWAI